MITNNIGCQPIKGPAALNFKQSNNREEPFNTTFASDLRYTFTGAGIITGLMALAAITLFRKKPLTTNNVIKEKLSKLKNLPLLKKLAPHNSSSQKADMPALNNRFAQEKDYLRASFQKMIGKYGYDTTVIKAPDGLVYIQVNHGKDLVGSVSYKDGKIIKQSSNFFSRFDKNSILHFDILA